MNEQKKIASDRVDCCVCKSKEQTILTTGKDYEYMVSNDEWTMVQCNECSHTYLNPRPRKENLGVIYPNNYYSYDFEKKGKNKIANKAKEMIDFKIVELARNMVGLDKTVLDVGCGDGRLLRLFKKDDKSKWMLYGVDLDETAGKIAEKEGIHFIKGSIDDVELPENKFDIIIMQQLIEHVFDPIKVLSKTHRALRKDGVLILETPSIPSLDFRLFKGKYWGGYHFPRHFNIFNEKSIRNALKEVGFNQITVKSLLSPVFWIHSLHNLAFDKKFPRSIVSFFYFKNPLLLSFFAGFDMLRLLTGFKTSNMRVIARK